MAEMNKRYYWLKLNENFFEDDTMSWLEEQENGKDYIIFYLKLCLKSLSDDGHLVRYVGEKLIPYDINALSRLTDTNKDTVRVAMKLFLEIGLIDQMDSGEIYMTQINEMIGSETDSARRMRKKRIQEGSRQKTLPSHCDTDVQKSDTEIEKELEKEKDIDTEREKEKDSLSYNQEVYDVLSDRNVDMSNAQACFNISKKLSDIDDIQYLNKAIDVAEKKGVLKVPYVLRVIENWIEDGKTTYQHLIEQDKKTVQQFKPKYGTPNDLTPEQEEQYNNLGF
ncbi:phage replisome organizer N-terminal domain-containing protein [Salinicoccus sp. HZC-1]|uniref:phage replisome organizer N-terminal domain-containing protein n=1 Tax=Salinicoccus sp. HZC-1 TaxID=3385497 RepID=UPI00398A7E0D